MSAAITLKRISEILGISISTVSRALKDHPDISKRTKQKVNELAETLDYEPNALAVNLKAKNTKLFVVIVPNFGKYFYGSFISGIEEECQKEGYNLLILQNSDNTEVEKENLKICRNNRVSGVFLCLCTKANDFKEYQKMLDLDIPLLFFDKVPDNPNFTRVSIDDVEAAAIGARELIKSKHKKVLAVMGNPEMSITKRRLKSFEKTIASSKINLKIEYAFNAEKAAEVSENYIAKKKCDAIFCMSDEIFTGVMLSVQKHKINIPSDMNIITMSDGFFPKLYCPQVTYVETSGYKLAKLAYEKMRNTIKDKAVPNEYLLEPILVKVEN
ncbi:MAG: LacI family DNA-binding transcriptional regulator [Chitinophagaceae bacterium]